MQSALLFCFAADHWFLVFSVMFKSCLMQFYVGRSLVRAEIAVAVAAPIENPADCEVPCYSFCAGR